ncbi:MAG TPA: ABC transporter permease [Bryobacteraceae bacterium]|nr:ABC transporter permease [Bryobacteraceae bacterium]
MKWLSAWRHRRDLAEEIRAHIEMETRENIERGMRADEARNAARRKFGNVTRVKEDVHEMGPAVFLETVLQDFIYALRGLRRSPGFSAIAVGSLAIGIGVNSSVFRLICGWAYPTFPYRDAGSIVQVKGVTKGESSGGDPSLSFPDYWDAKNTGVFAEVTFINPVELNSAVPGSLPQRLSALRVTTNFLSFLGVVPVQGRDFRAEESQAGQDHTAIIGYGYWERQFHSSPDVLGSTLRLEGAQYTIVGVVPEWFHWVGWSNTNCGDPVAQGRHCIDVFVPMATDAAATSRTAGAQPSIGMVLGRLRAGVTLYRARDELAVLSKQIAREHPETHKGWSMAANLFLDDLYRNHLPPGFVVIQVAVSFVLLIACVNVANLLLVRSTGRSREIAVRRAIGAGRARIVRQLFTEGLVLAVLSACAGLALIPVGARVLTAIIDVDWQEAYLDSRVTLFTAVTGIVTALLFALAPALAASREDGNGPLKAASRATAPRFSQRLRGMLVAGEIGLATVLLIGALLLIQSVYRYWQTDPVFQPKNLLVARIPLSDRKEERARTLRSILGRVKVLPGVAEATLASATPFISAGQRSRIRKEGDAREWSELPIARSGAVTAEFLSTIGIRILQGRQFTSADTEGSVAIINAFMARKFWPDESPIGKRIQINTPTWREVVGVMPDLPQWHLRDQMGSQVIEFTPAPPSPWLLIRTRTKPDDVLPPLRAVVASVDPDLPVVDVRTMEDAITRSFFEQTASLKLVGTFAGMALVLAAIGIYGVVSAFLAQRRQEFGVRVALGAQRGDLWRLIFSQAFRLACAGTLFGFVLGWGVTRFLAGALYGVSPRDFPTFAVSAGVLFAVSLLAAFPAARRAAGADPLVALRYE